jgi:hypothetical protein
MKGVCCECQSVNEVRMIGYKYKEIDFFDDERFLDEWVMKDHDFCGAHCFGSSTTPQALIK